MTDPNNEAFGGATDPGPRRAPNREFVTHDLDRKHPMRVTLNSRTRPRGAATLPGKSGGRRFSPHDTARLSPAEVLAGAAGRRAAAPLLSPRSGAVRREEFCRGPSRALPGSKDFSFNH